MNLAKLRALIRRTLDWWRQFRKTPAAPDAATPAASPGTGYLEPRSFTSLLVGMARHEHLKHQRLHVFSLSEFRKAAGYKWERVGDLVGLVVDQIIGHHIDPTKDLFTRLDAETACLVLPGASRQQARVQVASIARDLTAQLVGSQGIGGRRPQVVAANLAVSSVVNAEGGLRPGAIRRALAEAGAAAAGDAAAALPEEPLAAPHRTTLAALLAPEDLQLLDGGTAYADALAAMAPGEAPAWLAEQLNRSGRGGPLPVMRLDRDRKERGEPGEAPAWLAEQMNRGPHGGPLPVMTVKRERNADPAAVPDWLDGQMADRARAALAGTGQLNSDTSLTLLWTPTWVTNRRAIGAFQAKVVRLDGDATSPLEGIHAYAGTSPIEALTLDRFAASQTARELQNIYIGRQRVGLTVPLYWTSLAPRWRDCVRIPLEQCPAVARRKFLKVEVFGLSAAIPPYILRDLFGPLEKLGCDIMARLPLAAIDLIAALRNVQAVGVDLAELEDGDRVGDDELFARLQQFRLATRQAGMACYVWGVRRRPLIARLVGAGFSLLNGPGVMCDISRPHASTIDARSL